MRQTHWTTGEERRLAELYPRLGPSRCLDHFPGRSIGALRKRAEKLRVCGRHGGYRWGRRSTTS